MNPERLESALEGLRRFGGDDAGRVADHLEIAVGHSEQQSRRWTEQMCYSLRECLEGIPPLFGQERLDEPLGPIARRFVEEISDAVAVDSPPDVLRRLMSEFQERLDVAQKQRRFRIAQAMMTQAGAGLPTPQVDSFAGKWTSVVERVNNILHGDDHSEEEAIELLDRAMDLITALVGPISDRLEEVDRYAQLASPPEDVIRRMLDLLADERLARYFFNTVESPDWLRVLDEEGFFAVPMRGGWYQGEFLIRVSRQEPELAARITGRIARDEHPAAAAVVLRVVTSLGTSATPYGVWALSHPHFQDPFNVAHALEGLIDRWGDSRETATLPELADVALDPRKEESTSGVTAKFSEYNFGRLAQLFVARSECEDLARLGIVLCFKIRKVIRLHGGHATILSFGRDRVDDGGYQGDLGNSLISGVRDALGRLRECGAELPVRQAVLGDLDSEVFVRLWAEHLAEEEQDGS